MIPGRAEASGARSRQDSARISSVTLITSRPEPPQHYIGDNNPCEALPPGGGGILYSGGGKWGLVEATIPPVH